MRKMWICLMLLYAKFSFGMTSSAVIRMQCPRNCSCMVDNVTSLVVNCQEHPDDDYKQLSQQIDLLLSSNLTYGRLRSLNIVSTLLKKYHGIPWQKIPWYFGAVLFTMVHCTMVKHCAMVTGTTQNTTVH